MSSKTIIRTLLGFLVLLSPNVVSGQQDKVDLSYEREASSRSIANDCWDRGSSPRDLRLLATNKTSSMERELNAAANAGYRLQDVMGGETAFGGSEVVAIMCKLKDTDAIGEYEYKLLATNKTSTMQKELQRAGNLGYEYRGQTVFNTAFGNQEVVVILERDRDEAPEDTYEYKLLATKKTSTMQDELQAAGEAGYEFVGLTVSSTLFSGEEVVAILRRPSTEDRY